VPKEVRPTSAETKGVSEDEEVKNEQVEEPSNAERPNEGGDDEAPYDEVVDFVSIRGEEKEVNGEMETSNGNDRMAMADEIDSSVHGNMNPFNVDGNDNDGMASSELVVLTAPTDEEAHGPANNDDTDTAMNEKETEPVQQNELDAGGKLAMGTDGKDTAMNAKDTLALERDVINRSITITQNGNGHEANNDLKEYSTLNEQTSNLDADDKNLGTSNQEASPNPDDGTKDIEMQTEENQDVEMADEVLGYAV